MQQMKILLFVLLIVNFVHSNPILKDLISDRYEVDQIMKIEWTPEAGKDDSKTLLTIDVVNDRPEVMIDPFLVVDGISASQLGYSWTIPRYLKSSGEYHLRIYYQGHASPRGLGESGYGKAFQLINQNPMRQSTLNLIEPTGSADGTNLESTCLLGEQCFVVWDYPNWAESAMPKSIDIKLYSGDHMILLIAQGIPVTIKTFTWQVPSDAVNDPVHVVISASDKKIENVKPGQSFYLASSGYPFRLESRAEREQGRLASSQPRDFTAPGPIQLNITTTPTNSGSFLDIPRPTYASPINQKGTSTSFADEHTKQSISLSILASSLILLFLV